MVFPHKFLVPTVPLRHSMVIICLFHKQHKPFKNEAVDFMKIITTYIYDPVKSMSTHQIHIPIMNTNMTCSNPTGSINVTTTDHNPNSSNDKMYRGVRKRKWGKWVSEIRLPNSRKRIWLGSHDTQEKAARAFDAALYCLRGPHASFNFPNTPLTINVAFHGSQSLSPQEIQEVAAKYANESPPIELTQEEDHQVSSESQNDATSSGLKIRGSLEEREVATKVY